jgi:hypothetical protein
MKKAKLIKHKFGYNLVDTNGEFISTSKDEYSNGVNLKYWLSKQNCDEIFGVVSPEVMMKDVESNCDKTKEGYILGFQMAMEFNKEKLFTLEDIHKLVRLIHTLPNFELEQFEDENNVLQIDDFISHHLQQPTEIEVAVEMERIPDGLDESCHIQYAKVPKLDSEGNLILKKL